MQRLPARFFLGALLLPACAEQRAPGPEIATTGTADGGGDAAGFDADAGAPTELDAYVVPQSVDATVLDGGALGDGNGAAADATYYADAQLGQNPTKPALRESLVVPERWTLLDAGADPFEDRPSVVDCTIGVMAETLSDERVLGVETGWCSYLTAQQPTQRALAIGDMLKVRLWHFELSAPEPAEAHAALHVAGLQVLDERIAIPQPGGLIVRQLRVDRVIPEGTPVYFHLHNHGANSWALVEVSVGPSDLAETDDDAGGP